MIRITPIIQVANTLVSHGSVIVTRKMLENFHALGAHLA